MKPFILASQSPRRKQLLEQAELTFTIIPSEVEEIVNEQDSPEKVVSSLAYQKAQDVFSRFPSEVILAADTVVVVDEKILGKPQDKLDAKKMLQRLSGTEHDVLTGVSLLSAEKEMTFVDKTRVYFYSLTEAEIDSYIDSGEPFDKAGAYGIQGLGATLVEKIHGDYYTVVGLPIAKVVRALKQFHSE
ncbi:septum formation inhibitor Maf [Salipaludibacillus keqinensis]|uniref:dTTP/UTP pyrophosphatase n=1 Tax=Salipaludibacillus keqinensis TaxID=2045207 RepID=A0A323TJ69_9BACI|nr:Maf family protein [Salipaludibacillus keqinensis]PYZ93627.1 septum formation inhibitor Maf [Salipaludibacillus keqinensis]